MREYVSNLHDACMPEDGAISQWCEQGNTQDHCSLYKYGKKAKREDLAKAIQDWVDINKTHLKDPNPVCKENR